MKTRSLILPAVGLIGALLLPAVAQAQPPFTHPHNINQRLRDQHSRIERGEAHGTLGEREANRLEAHDRQIHSLEARDRFTHDGRLTPEERARLNGRLSRTSGAIYRHKRDFGTK